jgi:tetraacyldisaccharide 4'-kinase
MRIEEVWFGKSALAVAARFALLPLAGVYALGMAGYRAFYRLGLKQAKKSQAKIVCVGNLAAGGSGKTPVTIHIAQVLRRQGHAVVIGCSGYGSPRSEAATLAPGGPLDAAEWGDEPAEIRDSLPDIPIIVGRRRVLAAEICAREFPNAVLLMDDGFQHLPLAKDVTILIDPPTTNRFAFPAGPYRESRLLTAPTVTIPNETFKIHYSNLTFSSPIAKGEKVNILCAIAKPERFLEALRQHGLELVTVKTLGDHDPLTAPDLLTTTNPYPWVVTGKDAVKLRARKDLDQAKIIVATRTATIEPSTDFAEWLTMELG